MPILDPSLVNSLFDISQKINLNAQQMSQNNYNKRGKKMYQNVKYKKMKMIVCKNDISKKKWWKKRDQNSNNNNIEQIALNMILMV